MMQLLADKLVEDQDLYGVEASFFYIISEEYSEQHGLHILVVNVFGKVNA